MNVFNKNDPTSIGKARKLAEDVFGEGWEEKGASIYNEGPKKANVWGIGKQVRRSLLSSSNHLHRTVSSGWNLFLYISDVYIIQLSY